jgi:predicted  nucleic acid-binding Zn-ribbon protein
LQKTLNALIELQEIDLKLDRLNEERGDLPDIVNELTQKIQNDEETLKNYESTLKELKIEEKKIELDLDSTRLQLKKYEEQLYQVKTNKEYDAIANETESTKKSINESENRLLEIVELMENLDSSISELKKSRQATLKELKENKEDLQAKINESSEEENILAQEKNIVKKSLNKQYLTTYNRIRGAKNGVAVAHCNGGICSGCFSFIPPQKVVEIKNMKNIFTCESCGRILVWNQNEI